MLARSVNSQLKYGQVAAREKSVAAHVPYIRHVDEQTFGPRRGFSSPASSSTASVSRPPIRARSICA